MRTVPSNAEEANHRPSPDHEIPETLLPWTSSVLTARLLANSHSLIISSSLPLARIRPLGSKATHCTVLSCPCNVRRQWPVSASQSRIDLSSEGDASIRPSGDHAMRPTHPVCPRSVRTSFTPGGNFCCPCFCARRNSSFVGFLIVGLPTITSKFASPWLCWSVYSRPAGSG